MKKNSKMVMVIIAAVMMLVLGYLTWMVLRANSIRKRNDYMLDVISFSYDLCLDTGTDYYHYDPINGTFDTDAVMNYTCADENGLYLRVAYYNLQTGSDMTPEELLSSYDSYLAGESGSETEAIRDFHEARVSNAQIQINGESVSEGTFVTGVTTVIGSSADTATREQLDAAIDEYIASLTV